MLLWIHYFFYYFVFVILMRCLIDTQSLESLYIFSENTAMDFSDLLGGESYPIELIQDLPEDFPVSNIMMILIFNVRDSLVSDCCLKPIELFSALS